MGRRALFYNVQGGCRVKKKSENTNLVYAKACTRHAYDDINIRCSNDDMFCFRNEYHAEITTIRRRKDQTALRRISHRSSGRRGDNKNIGNKNRNNTHLDRGTHTYTSHTASTSPVRGPGR